MKEKVFAFDQKNKLEEKVFTLGQMKDEIQKAKEEALKKIIPTFTDFDSENDGGLERGSVYKINSGSGYCVKRTMVEQAQHKFKVFYIVIVDGTFSFENFVNKIGKYVKDEDTVNQYLKIFPCELNSKQVGELCKVIERADADIVYIDGLQFVKDAEIDSVTDAIDKVSVSDKVVAYSCNASSCCENQIKTVCRSCHDSPFTSLFDTLCNGFMFDSGFEF